MLVDPHVGGAKVAVNEAVLLGDAQDVGQRRAQLHRRAERRTVPFERLIERETGAVALAIEQLAELAGFTRVVES